MGSGQNYPELLNHNPGGHTQNQIKYTLTAMPHIIIAVIS